MALGAEKSAIKMLAGTLAGGEMLDISRCYLECCLILPWWKAEGQTGISLLHQTLLLWKVISFVRGITDGPIIFERPLCGST